MNHVNRFQKWKVLKAFHVCQAKGLFWEAKVFSCESGARASGLTPRLLWEKWANLVMSEAGLKDCGVGKSMQDRAKVLCFWQGGCPLFVGIYHFWREHPPNHGTGLFILGQHYVWFCPF